MGVLQASYHYRDTSVLMRRPTPHARSWWNLLCRVLLERSLARQLPDELRLQYRYSTGGTVPVRIDLDQIDKFSSDTVSLRTIQYGGPCSM